MLTLVRQELFKLYKKKSTFILFGAVMLLMTLIAFLSSKQPDILDPRDMFISAYSGFAWLVFILIVQAATIITMEFEYGTIKNLLFRNYSRTQVLVSKWIALLVHSLMMFAGTALIAVVLKLIIHSDFGFTDNVSGGLNAIQSLIGTTAGTFVNVWLLVSLVLLLSCLFRSTAISVVFGIVFYFAASIVSGILFLLIEKWEWLKWNPVNMLNLGNQIISEDLETATHLSVTQMTIASLGYTAIFLFLVYVVFRRKNV